MSAPQPDDALIAAAQKCFAAAFGAVLKLSPAQGEALWIDGRQDPPGISAEPPENKIEPACIWRGGREPLLRSLANERSLVSAFLAGRISIAGDISVMARLEPGARR